MAASKALFLVATLALLAVATSASAATSCSLTNLNVLSGCGLLPVSALCSSTLKSLPSEETGVCLCKALQSNVLILDGVTNTLSALSFITNLLTSLGLPVPLLGSLTCIL